MSGRLPIIACCAIVALVCQGCWDRVEIEDIAWVQSVGFDKGPGGYVTTTFEIGVPHSLRGAAGPTPGGGQAAPRYVVVTVVSRAPFDALDLVSVTIGRRLSLQHTQLFVFGEELARSDIRGLIGAIDRYREVRRSALVAVARGRAEDVLRVTMSPLEVSPSRFIQTMLQQHVRTGLFEGTRFSSFVSALESGSSSPSCPIIALSREIGSGGASAGEYPPIPRTGERMMEPEFPPGFDPARDTVTQLEAGQIPYIGGGPITVMGTAVFSGGRMVGDLGGDETTAMLMIKGDFERGGYSIADPQMPDRPEYSLSFGLRSARPRVSVLRNGDSTRINVRLALLIDYISMRTQTDYTDPRNARLVEQAVAAYMKRVMDSAITRTQKEMKADVFGFGNKVRHTFLTWPEFDEFAWLSKYPDARITTEVSARLVRYGMDLAPPRIPPGEIILRQQNP